MAKGSVRCKAGRTLISKVEMCGQNDKVFMYLNVFDYLVIDQTAPKKIIDE